MLPPAQDFASLKAAFRWAIPARYNMAVDCCDRWAEEAPDRTALILADAPSGAAECSYGELRALSNQMAHCLQAAGAAPGDRIGVLLPQCLETVISHLAIWKIGGISVPLFSLFGLDALQYRLQDSEARIVITNQSGAQKLARLRPKLPRLMKVFTSEQGDPAWGTDLHQALAGYSPLFLPYDSAAGDPALIIYTSGTTGPPKGALHAHRVLLGHLPGVEISHDFFPKAGDRIWTPADWAWIGGLLDVLMPALHHGVPVVAKRFAKFTGEAAFQLLQDYGVRNAFLPPTALKMMRSVTEPRHRWRFSVRSLASGGESLGAELLAWGERVFGVTINEFYGQTECNMVISSAASLMPAKPGWMGRAVPGHHLAILDEEGLPAPPGTPGEIAIQAPDPVMFLGYWNRPEARAEKFRGDWLITGDIGLQDADGWFQYLGRKDDMISSAGYRIGPGEVEDCLLSHPAIKMAAVIGKPDAERGEVIKAFLVLNTGYDPSPDLIAALQNHVRLHLGQHEYPREIAFVGDLPLTSTGKVMRRLLRESETAQGIAQGTSRGTSHPERPDAAGTRLRARTIRAYQAAYPDPLTVEAGEWVAIDKADEEWPDFVWCRNRNEKGGWVPKSYLSNAEAGGNAYLLKTYSAQELTIPAGECIDILESEGGWHWARSAAGLEGWLPGDCLEFIGTPPPDGKDNLP